MSSEGPRAELPSMPYEVGSADDMAAWEDALAVMASARTCWLITTQPDGRPHVMPVWAVWIDGALCFSTDAESRKGKNLARDPRCAIAMEHNNFQLVVEGEARRLTDEAALQRFVDAYNPKYDWSLTVRDGSVYDDSGSGGPVFALKPKQAIGQTDDESFTPTRWRFDWRSSSRQR